MNSVAPAPGAVRLAGFIVTLQGVTALLMAAVLVLRGLTGADQRVVGGVSLAVCFGLIGAGVLAAGRALMRGRRWGRGAAVFANLLALAVAWYVAVGSHRWVYGILLGLAGLTVLGLLLSRSAVHWVTRRPTPTGSS